MTDRLRDLLTIMARLRAPGGCPWDRDQTFASLAPYAIEEAYEVADAAERGDVGQLKDELGDLLFQVVFHAQIASEAGQFDFDAVAAAIGEKLLRRHPHVFERRGRLTGAQQSVVWEDIKAREREAHGAMGAAGGTGAIGALHGVPLALPALLRADKLSKRAARVGFDFDHASQAADKVAEELAEVRAAAAAALAPSPARVEQNGDQSEVRAVADDTRAPSQAIFEEIGDLLFAAANLARTLEVDAETALRAANAKFERRFRGMESLAAARGLQFAQLDLAAQERLWQEVKRGE